MSDKLQVIHLSNDLDEMINRYRSEYDITYAEVVGVLQMKIHLLCSEAEKTNEDDW